jgi:hypothetical protein
VRFSTAQYLRLQQTDAGRFDLGYLVTTPHAERPAPYKYIFEDGKMFDVQVRFSFSNPSFAAF